MSIFCGLIREECNIFHSQSTVKTLESASQLPYRHMWRRYVCWREKLNKSNFLGFWEKWMCVSGSLEG